MVLPPGPNPCESDAMILEDAHGNYVDRNAYNAAYQALQPSTQHAQIRDQIATEVAVAVTAQRTEFGLNRLTDLASDDPNAGRDTLVQLIQGGLTGVSVPSSAIGAAVVAAAKAVAQ